MENNKKDGFGRKPAGRRDYGSKQEGKTYGERKISGQRPRIKYGETSEGRPYSERKSYSDKTRRSFGDTEGRTYGERKVSGQRPRINFSENQEGRTFEERKSYGNRQRRSFEESEGRPYGERRSYGERPRRSSNGEKTSSYHKSKFGDRKFGDRKFNDRRYGDRKFSRRPAEDRDYSHFRNEEESGINKMINRRPLVEEHRFSDNDFVKPPIQEVVRLNKFIANSGICSRREADNFILAGVVTVNGEVITELGTKININTDEVRFNGERLKGEEKVYIVMNKPKGYVTTTSDPHAEKTVMDLIKKCKFRVFPVGRLDKNTTGVLMFTNDGEMAEKLTHPSYDKKKIYQVSLNSKLKQEDYDKIMSGVELPDGVIKADALEYIEEDDHRKLGIEIHSGKNRIVRRIFEALGYEVKALDRVYFAGLTKKGLKRGEWRFLTSGEANILKMGAYN